MTYYQITSEERYTIAALRREGFCSAEIARRGQERHQEWGLETYYQITSSRRCDISREVRRNSSPSDGCYRPSKAIERTNGRRSRSRRNQYFTKADFALVEKKLKADWSPEQISGHLRLHGELSISHETIYTHVWRDKEAGGHLYRHLRCSPKLRRKRHNSYDSRGRLAGKRHISERPSCIDKRRAVGHWEIDTVVGKDAPDCVTTLVERKTGYALIGKLSDRSMFGTSQRTKMLLRRVPDQVKDHHRGQWHGVPRLRIRRGSDRRQVLLCNSLSLMGERQQRELQWPATTIPAEAHQPSSAHATPLRWYRKEAQHTAPQEARLPHTGGTFPWELTNGALQT